MMAYPNIDSLKIINHCIVALPMVCGWIYGGLRPERGPGPISEVSSALKASFSRVYLFLKGT